MCVMCCDDSGRSTTAVFLLASNDALHRIRSPRKKGKGATKRPRVRRIFQALFVIGGGHFWRKSAREMDRATEAG